MVTGALEAGEGELAHEVADVEGVTGRIETAINRDGLSGCDAFAESGEIGAIGRGGRAISGLR